MVNFFSYFLTCSNHSTLNDVISKRMITIHKDGDDDDDGKYGEEYDDYQCTPNGLIRLSFRKCLLAKIKIATKTFLLHNACHYMQRMLKRNPIIFIKEKRQLTFLLACSNE